MNGASVEGVPGTIGAADHPTSAVVTPQGAQVSDPDGIKSVTQYKDQWHSFTTAPAQACATTLFVAPHYPQDGVPFTVTDCLGNKKSFKMYVNG